MSRVGRNQAFTPQPFHAVTHHTSPKDVLKDRSLSTDEKRIILSAWASDMYAVESQPHLRDIPGIPERMRIADILAALNSLDDDPPSGGLSMPRLRARRVADVIGSSEETDDLKCALIRAHQGNICRYRRLLETQLSDLERRYVLKRLSEERSALSGLLMNKVAA